MINEDYIDWPEQELRLATLQLLYRERKRDIEGGLSGVTIGEDLQVNLVEAVEPALLWLLDKALIEAGEAKFLITDAGIAYLIEELPKPAKSDEQ